MNKPKKVALAYSGGLDTSVIIPWLKENYGCEVVAVCGDIGQGADELTGLEEKARKTGASEVYVEDMREEFVSQYLWKLVRSGGVYEHKYLLGTSIARPLLAKKQVEVALATGCDALAHGCTGKGNDQVRFELTYKALAPQLRGDRAVARVDHRFARGRHRVRARAQRAHLRHPPPRSTAATATSGTSRTRAARSKTPPTPRPTTSGCSPRAPPKRPIRPAKSTIGFENGVPVSVDGKQMNAFELLETLNRIGAEHGIGRIDLVENRFVGMKSRGCYETPGGTLIMFAMRELEALTLDRNTLHYKQQLALDYAEMVYNGLWFTPLREALDAFFAEGERDHHRRSEAAALQGQHRAALAASRRIRSTRSTSPASPWAPATTRRTRWASST